MVYIGHIRLGGDMSENLNVGTRRRFWITVVAIVIALIFLYFYRPFETYLVQAVPNARFSNSIFWFASTAGIIIYVVAHWSSFRHKMSSQITSLDAGALVFDTLQTSILIAVIFLAGATLQSIAILAIKLMNSDPLVGSGIGSTLISIVLLLILTLLFYLLHHLMRTFRDGWSARKSPPRTVRSVSNS